VTLLVSGTEGSLLRLKWGRAKRKEERDGKSLQTSKAAANGTARQKSELHGTIEEAAEWEAEEILYPISFQQGCKPTLDTRSMPLCWLCYRHNNHISVVIEPGGSFMLDIALYSPW
jgi:hypothetical protein